MQLSTRTALDAWYGATFDVPADQLWRRVTVRPHARLRGATGYYVAWRGRGVHVSAPATADRAVVRRLASTPAEALRRLGHWEAFAAAQGLRVAGPSTHSYLDTAELIAHALPVGTSADVREIEPAVLPRLEALVAADEWATSGWTDSPAHSFGLFEEDGSLVAAANLNSFAGAPRDVGVLVAPHRRGRGLSALVGRHAAASAIRHYGFARWGARNANGASIAAARRLGFRPFCTQLWVR